MAGYWRDLYEKMREDLQSPAFRQFGSYSIAGRSFSYRSLDDFRSLLDWVKREADKEDGIALGTEGGDDASCRQGRPAATP